MAALLRLATVLATASAKLNVLYVLVDDLRPSIEPYTDNVPTPHLRALAQRGVVFDRAYANQAVCSPSRNSFLTGLRPRSTKAWNFVNHVRQADCGLEVPDAAWRGDEIAEVSVARDGGMAGECCSHCTLAGTCAKWTYANGTCFLHGAAATRAPASGAVSGASGADVTWWARTTTTPQHFRERGYWTAGAARSRSPGFFEGDCPP